MFEQLSCKYLISNFKNHIVSKCRRHRKQDPFQNLTSEELEMDFIFEDVSSGSPTLKFSGDEDDNKKSFYLEDDFDEGNPADLSMKDNLGNEQDKELNQSMKGSLFQSLKKS